MAEIMNSPVEFITQLSYPCTKYEILVAYAPNRHSGVIYATCVISCQVSQVSAAFNESLSHLYNIPLSTELLQTGFMSCQLFLYVSPNIRELLLVEFK
jgi:hypothetical protein